MRFSDSCTLFNKLQESIISEDIFAIGHICKALFLPQRSSSISYYLFFAEKAECKIEPDDIVLVSSVISLACKLCETYRPLEKILKTTADYYAVSLDAGILELYSTSINKTEIELSIILDFNFEISEIYTHLENCCKEKQVDSVFSRRCWIMLNDIMTTPLPIYFTIDELLASLFFINFLASELKNKMELSEQMMYDVFIEKYGYASVPFDYLEFICGKVLDNYVISKECV